MKRALRVRFNTAFYSLEAVRKSIDAYSGAAAFTIKKRKNAIEVVLSDFSEEIAGNLEKEFANYVLFIEGIPGHGKNRARQ